MLLINEALVSPFKFWSTGQIQQGMRFRNELFRYIAKFERTHRQQAFDLAWIHSQNDASVVVTVTQLHYTVWESLRSFNPSPQASSTGSDLRILLDQIEDDIKLKVID
ncbi:MAG: hypothetical protein HC769_25725 [Cyanobacteria bacterium CRU_2_1]|nr:hypothetical protein [Cyanobacteria bacterium CRU_2_1]